MTTDHTPALAAEAPGVPATQPLRQPLTEADILAAGREADCGWLVETYSVSMAAFARAVHRITTRSPKP